MNYLTPKERALHIIESFVNCDYTDISNIGVMKCSLIVCENAKIGNPCCTENIKYWEQVEKEVIKYYETQN